MGTLSIAHLMWTLSMHFIVLVRKAAALDDFIKSICQPSALRDGQQKLLPFSAEFDIADWTSPIYYKVCLQILNNRTTHSETLA